jgi:hypothetical protein
MSAIHTACCVNPHYGQLQWFAYQPVLAPINICHIILLDYIYLFLMANTNIWAMHDARRLCTLGDSNVALYDQPMDKVDLTMKEELEGEQQSEVGPETEESDVDEDSIDSGQEE